MARPQKKSDPIRDQYYAPLERAELASNLLFYWSAFLSLAGPLISRADNAVLYDAVQTAFIVSVALLFAVTLSIRLHFSPRAQDKRYQDFLSHAFQVPLSHERTSGYYNSSAPDGTTRIAAQLLENSFYSKDTAQQMSRNERIKLVLYVIVWFVVFANRSTDLATAAIVAQIVFSEQLLSRWLRLEWFRIQCEAVFDTLFKLFQSKADLQISALELAGRYEQAKATAGLTLSSRIFEKRAFITDRGWKTVRETLGI